MKRRTQKLRGGVRKTRRRRGGVRKTRRRHGGLKISGNWLRRNFGDGDSNKHSWRYNKDGNLERKSDKGLVGQAREKPFWKKLF